MEIPEVLIEWLGKPITFKCITENGETIYEINDKNVNEEDFIDTEATIVVLTNNIIREITKELVNKDVYCSYDEMTSDYIDVKEIVTDKVLFSIKVANVKEYKVIKRGYKVTWKPLLQIIKDTITAVKGYLLNH